MTPQDRTKFLEIVIGFAELKGRQLSAPALELYWRSMQHWSIEDFSRAAEHLVRTCKFMPGPADFEALRKAGRPTPGEAWQKALGHCASGNWRSGKGCGDPAVDAAVAACGGWQAVAHCDIDKLGFIERRFAEHYDTAEDRNDTRQAVPELTAGGRSLAAIVYGDDRSRGLLEEIRNGQDA